AEGPVSVQRRVLSLKAKTERAVDLSQESGLDAAKLVSQDESGYPYCQGLARQALKLEAQLLRAPSARHEGGFCTPIFDKTAVAKDEGHLKYLRCTLHADGRAQVTAVTEGQPREYRVVSPS
ncbi:MAG TPA: RES family NAD+ phosphorylase, partial [bacterium]|nr:RES family NAD+ phosphorylase [bacterium]